MGSMTTNTSPPRATARSWIGLVVLVLPLLLIAIDGTVLLMALPEISAELSPTGTEQLWMIDMYSLILASLLVAMATVGERFGRRRNLLIGAVLFTIASVLGALSTSAWMLIGARALLGVGGAIMMPSTLSLVRNMFLDREQRRYAMAIWGAMASVGAAAGPILGGWIIEAFSWHAAFLMNIPVMVLLLILGPLLLPESRNPELRSIDLLSVGLSLVGLFGIVYGIKTLAADKDDDMILGIIAAGVGILAIVLFVRRQLRLATPLLNVRLFTIPYFRGAVVTDVLSIFAMVGSLVALVQFLQLVSGFGPLEAGIWLIPQAIFAATAGFIAASLARHFLPAYIIVSGLMIAVIGFGLTLLLSPSSSPWLIATLLSLVALGAGMGLTLSNDIIMSSVKPEHAGQAAATSETGYEVGTTMGTAVLGGILVAWYSRVAADGLTGLGLPEALEARASSTMAEALQVSREIGGTAGAEVVDVASRAFTDAITVTGLAGAGVMLLAAVWAFWTLRGAKANQDLAVD